MTEPRYSPWTRHLHWVVFVLVACALLLIYIHDWTPRSSSLHANAKWAHMQFGMAVLLVMLARLLVRSRAPAAPSITPAPPAWQRWAARCMHLALYVLLIVTPVLGIANRMWSPGAWNLLGIPMPHVTHPDGAFSHMLEGIHEDFGNILMYLAALHAVIALFHHFAQRDNTLKRMLPARRGEG